MKPFNSVNPLRVSFRNLMAPPRAIFGTAGRLGSSVLSSARDSVALATWSARATAGWAITRFYSVVARQFDFSGLEHLAVHGGDGLSGKQGDSVDPVNDFYDSKVIIEKEEKESLNLLWKSKNYREYINVLNRLMSMLNISTIPAAEHLVIDALFRGEGTTELLEKLEWAYMKLWELSGKKAEAYEKLGEDCKRVAALVKQGDAGRMLWWVRSLAEEDYKKYIRGPYEMAHPLVVRDPEESSKVLDKIAEADREKALRQKGSGEERVCTVAIPGTFIRDDRVEGTDARTFVQEHEGSFGATLKYPDAGVRAIALYITRKLGIPLDSAVKYLARGETELYKAMVEVLGDRSASSFRYAAEHIDPDPTDEGTVYNLE